MSAPDELQKLWQNIEAKQEDSSMWKALIQEKRRGWDELIKAEDMNSYVAALCVVPLTVWGAWKAKYPWVHVGYGLMAVTFVLFTMQTWIASRERPQERGMSLRQHLEALLRSYDQRSRLIRRGGWWLVGGLIAGVAAVFMGMPGANMISLVVAMTLIVSFSAACLVSSRMGIARITRKREEAIKLLQGLLAGEPEIP
jgi:hypothetical protein